MLKIKENIFYILITLIIGFFSYLIFKNFVLLLTDEIRFIVPTIYIKGIWISDRIGDSLGRFLPFQFLDYTILKLFNLKYYYITFPVFLIFKICLLTFLLIKIFFDINKFEKISKINLLNILFFFTLFFSFAGITRLLLEYKYSEITQCLFILLFAFFYQRAYFTNKAHYYILSFLSAFYSTYMKECMFIPYIVIAITNLLFLKNQNKKWKYFNLSLILNGTIFLILYYFLVYRHTITFYNSLYQQYKILSIEWFLNNILIISFFFISSIKGFSILKKRKSELFDSFLFAGLFYSLSYVILGLNNFYYHFVSYTFFIIWIYNYLLKENNRYIKIGWYLICIFMMFIQIIKNYKEYIFIRSKIQIAKEFYNNIKNKRTVLYAFGNPYFLTDFISKIHNHDFYEYVDFNNCYFLDNKKKIDLNNYDMLIMDKYCSFTPPLDKTVKMDIYVMWGSLDVYKIQ